MKQLSMFTDADILKGKELAEYEAMLFVVNQIVRSCSNRNLIKDSLKEGDKKIAYKWFLDSFRTFGFGFPKSYSFTSYRNEGRIRYHFEGKEETLIASPKELFAILMEKD